jgi:pimeloyl-ACP methyl ester carboxylesterase
VTVSGIYKSEAGKQAIEGFYRKVLGRWPVAHEQIVVPTRHGDTFVIACGPAGAPSLILLHGSGSNSAVWIRDVVEWAERYRVYAVDVIGEPGLSAPSRPPLRAGTYADWLGDVCQQLSVLSASLVGVSLGGWLALAYAVKSPARVASLTLLSPAGIGARNQIFMLKAMALLFFGKLGIRKASSAALGRAATGPATEYIRLIFENFHPRREPPPVFTDAELGDLRCALQVIVGADDAMIHAWQTRDRVARLLPNAEMLSLEKTGHMLPPQTSRVAEFLDTVWNAEHQRQHTVTKP